MGCRLLDPAFSVRDFRSCPADLDGAAVADTDRHRFTDADTLPPADVHRYRDSPAYGNASANRARDIKRARGRDYRCNARRGYPTSANGPPLRHNAALRAAASCRIYAGRDRYCAAILRLVPLRVGLSNRAVFAALDTAPVAICQPWPVSPDGNCLQHRIVHVRG